MTLIRRQIAPPAERYLVISVALVAVRACFRVRRRSTRTSTDGPPGSSVNPSRQARINPEFTQGRQTDLLFVDGNSFLGLTSNLARGACPDLGSISPDARHYRPIRIQERRGPSGMRGCG